MLTRTSPHIAVLLGDYGTSEWAARDLSLRWYHRTFEVLGPILRTLRAPDGVLAVRRGRTVFVIAPDGPSPWQHVPIRTW